MQRHNIGKQDDTLAIRQVGVQAVSDDYAECVNKYGFEFYNPRHVPVIPVTVHHVFDCGLADGIFVICNHWLVAGAYRDGYPFHPYPEEFIPIDELI